SSSSTERRARRPCAPGRGTPVRSRASSTPKWRNRQTRRTQNPLSQKDVWVRLPPSAPTARPPSASTRGIHQLPRSRVGRGNRLTWYRAGMRPPREAKKAPRGPTALGEVLGETRELSLKRSRAAGGRDAWRRAVGRRSAERTEVGALRGGGLTVYVAPPAWAQERSLLTTDIRERLSGFGVRVERIRFRLLAAPPPAPRREPPPRLPKKVVPPELAARLEHVEDEELRRAIEGAAGLALGRLE